MTALSNYLEDKILQHVFMGVPYTAPANIYLGLVTVAATDSSVGTEVTGGSYARQVVTFDLAPGGAGKISNDTLLTYTNMPEADIVGGILMDAVSGGNLLAHGTVTPFSTVAGENLIVPIGNFNFYLG